MKSFCIAVVSVFFTACLHVANAGNYIQIVTSEGNLYDTPTGQTATDLSALSHSLQHALSSAVPVQSFSFNVDSYRGVPTLNDFSISSRVDAGLVVLLEYMTSNKKLPGLVIAKLSPNSSMVYSLNGVSVTSFSANLDSYEDNEDSSSSWVTLQADDVEITCTSGSKIVSAFNWTMSSQNYRGRSKLQLQESIMDFKDESLYEG